MTDFTMLYASTAFMLILSVGFIWHIANVSKFKSYVYKKDIYYNARFDSIEKLFTEDLKPLLKQLKDKL